MFERFLFLAVILLVVYFLFIRPVKNTFDTEDEEKEGKKNNFHRSSIGSSRFLVDEHRKQSVGWED